MPRGLPAPAAYPTHTCGAIPSSVCDGHAWSGGTFPRALARGTSPTRLPYHVSRSASCYKRGGDGRGGDPWHGSREVRGPRSTLFRRSSAVAAQLPWTLRCCSRPCVTSAVCSYPPEACLIVRDAFRTFPANRPMKGGVGGGGGGRIAPRLPLSSPVSPAGRRLRHCKSSLPYRGSHIRSAPWRTCLLFPHAGARDGCFLVRARSPSSQRHGAVAARACTGFLGGWEGGVGGAWGRGIGDRRASGSVVCAQRSSAAAQQRSDGRGSTW